MGCEFDAMLSPYRDGELGAAERDRLEAHLAGCAACRATLAAYGELGARAAAYETSEDPFARRRALAAVLAAGRSAAWRRRVAVPAPALPALVLLAAAGAFLLGRALPAGGPGAAPESPRVEGASPAPPSGLARFDRGGRAVIVVTRNAGVPR